VAVLMEGLGETLSARAGSLSEYVLAGRLDAAVRASSAQFDDPDTLGRLRVRLGRATSSETGAPPPRRAAPGGRPPLVTGSGHLPVTPPPSSLHPSLRERVHQSAHAARCAPPHSSHMCCCCS